MPRDLANAGWNVALLAPKGSLAEKSRFVRQVGHLPENATPLQWVFAFAATVKSVRPRLLMPCDDTSFRLLRLLAIAPPASIRPPLHAELLALIADSMGNPDHYRTSVDKTLVCQAAEKSGVRVPAYDVVADLPSARRFAAVRGFPVVLKRSHSSAGSGVRICDDGAVLEREFAGLASEQVLDLDDADARNLLIQEFIPGRTRYFAGTAWRGTLLCGYAVDKVAGDENGPASVVRYFHSPELYDSAARLAAAFGASGIFAPEYVVHATTGEPYLVEVNRRVTPGTHRGELFGMSSGAALRAAVDGGMANIRTRLDDREKHVYVSFPHEWLRDPQSRYLREHPIDIPWDDPELFEAMLAMRKN